MDPHPLYTDQILSDSEQFEGKQITRGGEECGLKIKNELSVFERTYDHMKKRKKKLKTNESDTYLSM